jgi:hypothetical protein
MCSLSRCSSPAVVDGAERRGLMLASRLMLGTLRILVRATGTALSSAPARAVANHIFGNSPASIIYAKGDLERPARVAWDDWMNAPAQSPSELFFPLEPPPHDGARPVSPRDRVRGMEIRAARLTGPRRRRGHG